jgi:tetratricopeptide (TPR) repeat protein
MNRKLTEIIIGVGILLILLTFNPFVSPGLYFDSTSAFTFMALHKVMLLGLLNLVLLVMWAIHAARTKELQITASKLYIPVFVFVLSSLVSTLLSVNKTNSLFGFNSTLANSFVETGMLATFFFIFVNNVRDSESVQRVLRFFTVGMAVVVLWTLFRYSGTWSNGSIYLRDYVNSIFFTPSGHYGSLIVLCLVSMLISIGLTVTSMVQNRSKNILIVDAVSLLVVSTGFFNFLNIAGRVKPYFYIVCIIAAVAAVGYLLFTNRRLKTTLVPVLSLVLLGLVLGFGSYFGITHRKVQPSSFPSMPMNVSWNISLDSIKASMSKGMFGIGQSNFTYAFDRFKNDSLVPGNLTINNNAPSVPEIRINHAGSYFLETLSAQGLVGLISFIAIFALFTFTGIRKMFTEMHPMGVFILIAFVLLGMATIVTGYDFTLLLTMWLLLAVLMVLYHEGEPQQNLNISLAGRSFDGNGNLNYLIPTIMVIGAGLVVFNAYKITNANVSAFWAKRFQSLGNLQQYQASSLDAVNKYPTSDVFIRELVNANGAILMNQLDELQKKVTDDPKAKENQDVINAANDLSNFQRGILSNLLFAINQYPDEYKNYYLAGLLTSRVSEYANLGQDQAALEYFANSISKNPYHPDTYFQMAKLYERNKNANSAFNNIQLANTYDTNNLFYQVKYADILVSVEGYDQALNIYNAFKDYKEKNPNNEQIQEFYKAQDIDTKITSTTKSRDEAAKKKAEEDEKAKQANPTTTPTPTPKATVTPTKAPAK